MKLLLSLILGLFLLNLVLPLTSANVELIHSQPLSVFDRVLNFIGFNIIPISGAVHLNQDKYFVSDVYEQVKEQDNLWSEIPSNDYVRAVFERELDSRNDITIYARNKSSDASVEVYLKDGTDLITTINVNGEGLYKTYLTGLTTPTDTFDLKSIGDIEYDWITDPTPQANDSSTVYQCGTLDTAGTYTVNQSITNATSTCINITTQDITLDCAGFTITTTGNFNALYSKGINTTVKNCILKSTAATGFALKLVQANNSYFYNNTFWNSNRVAIATSTASNIIFENNNITGVRDGVLLLTGNNNTIQYNKFVIGSGYTNTFTGYNNTIQYNNVTGGDEQISISSGGTNLVLGNYLQSASMYGILLTNTAGNRIINNTANASTQISYFVSSNADSDCNNEFTRNMIGNSSYLFEYYNSSVNINGGTHYELFLCNADNSILDGLIVTNMSSLKNNGIIVARTSNLTIMNTNISNRYDGIYIISASTSNYIINVDSKGNILNGINIGSSPAYISNSNISGNTGSGIYLNSPNNIINNVTTSNNLINGFEILNGNEKNSITNSIALNNTQYGISIDRSLTILINITLMNNGYTSSTGSLGLLSTTATSSDSYIENLYINGSKSYAIRTTGTTGKINNIVFKNIKIENTASPFSDVYLQRNIVNITFLNATYSTENISTSVTNSNNSLSRKWYYQAKANFTNGTSMNGLRVLGWDANGVLIFNDTTGSDGLTIIGNTTEYLNRSVSNVITTTYFSNYTFNATYDSNTISFSHNISSDHNILDIFNFPASTDTAYPIFSNYYDNSGTLVNSGIGLFNVTVENTNGNVWLEINNTNVTATNLTANVYNVSYNFTNAGSYPYKWWAYGNGTLVLLNNSGLRSYVTNIVTNVTACGTISSEGTYNLNKTITTTGTCFTINANNVILDCNGFALTYSSGGALGYGIKNFGYNNTIIRNCIIKEGSATTLYKYGIYFINSNNNTILNNNISTKGEQSMGMFISNSNSNNIINNIMNSTGDDAFNIYLNLSSNFLLLNNSANATLANSYQIYGNTLAHFNHSIDTTNLAKGLPINYTFNANNVTYDTVNYTGWGAVMFGWGNNITIKNSNFSAESLIFMGVSNSLISNNTVRTRNGYGLYLFSNSNNNILSFNNIYTDGTQFYDIHLGTMSNNNSIFNNTCVTIGSNAKGIRLEELSNSNLIYNNVINTSSSTKAYGIYLTDAYYNIVTNNKVTTSEYGIYLKKNTQYNVFANNTILTYGTSKYGIALEDNAQYNNFTGENVRTLGATAHGIYLTTNTNGNNFLRMNVTTSVASSNALYLADTSQNFTMIDSILNSTAFELNITKNVNNGTWSLTNITTNSGIPIRITWGINSDGTLTNSWWLDINVTDNSGNPISSANIDIWDNNSNSVVSISTGADGLVRQSLLEFTNVSNTYAIYYSNYTVNITKAGYTTSSNEVNMSINRVLNIVLQSGDTIYPIFSNYYDNNASIINSGIGLFNVTLANTNGTVWLEINNTNVTATNLTANVYNVSYNFTNSGTYSYKWWSYGNGTSANLNNSGLRYYTVNSSVQDTCTPPAINNNWNVIWADNCTVSTNVNLGTGKLYLSGSNGRFSLNGNLTIKGRSLTCSSNCKFIQQGRLIYG